MPAKDSNLAGRVDAATRAKAEYIAGKEKRKLADWVRLSLEGVIEAYEAKHGEIKLPEDKP
jgi:hypothetical protein